jgi:KDO2-lipid IV(A) lauroyltransferase
MAHLLVWTMRLLAYFPLRSLRALGWFLGSVLFELARRRRHVVNVNLALCFPDKSQPERRALARQHFVLLAQSFLDRAWLWHAPLAKVQERIKWFGPEQALAALAAEQATLIFAPHFVGLDAGGLALTMRVAKPVAFIFVPQHNAVLDDWVNQGRQRGGQVKPYFRHDGVKQIISGMRHGEVLHLSPDMDFGAQESMFVPFMGVPAATLPSLPRFAKSGRAQVMPMLTRLTPQGYEIELLAPWTDFPSDDLAADTLRMNDVLATWIAQNPAQYYWVHKRFKTRPLGEASLYTAL